MKHKLSHVVPEQRTAVCTVCGPVPIVRHGRGAWRCKVAHRASCPNRNKYQLISQASLEQKPYAKYKRSNCERCGFVPEHTCQLDVHHKDHDHQNNAEENLQTLCSNCHRLDEVGLL